MRTEIKKPEKIVFLKVKIHKMNDIETLTYQITKVARYLSKRYGLDPSRFLTKTGYVNEDFILDKFTVRLTIINKNKQNESRNRINN